MSSTITISPSASIQITPNGAIITGNLDEKQWIHAVRTLKDIKAHYLTALGDVIGYGISHFGEETVGKHIEQLEFNLADANTALGIASLTYDFKSAYPLTPEHYYLLAKLPTDKDKEKWAQTAIEHKLSALELKRSIESGAPVSTKEINKKSGLGSGIATIEGALFHFNQWKQKIGEEKLIELPRQSRIELLEKLRPVLDLAERIASTLAAAPDTHADENPSHHTP